MSTKEECRENELLASELGYESGHQRYKWCYSENLLMPFRVEGDTTQTVSDGGLVLVQPKYELRKAAKHLFRQWVVCKWIAPGDESDWRQNFGSALDYPRNGIYFPTNVYLDEGVSPWDTDQEGVSITRYVIGLIREQAKKSLADWKAEGEAIIAHRERETDRKLDNEIGDLMLPFGHVPGSREGGTSLPSKESTANHDAAFGVTQGDK